jgi:hypothetical protein
MYTAKVEIFHRPKKYNLFFSLDKFSLLFEVKADPVKELEGECGHLNRHDNSIDDRWIKAGKPWHPGAYVMNASIFWVIFANFLRAKRAISEGNIVILFSAQLDVFLCQNHPNNWRKYFQLFNIGL